MLSPLFHRRFVELAEAFMKMPFTRSQHTDSSYVEEVHWKRWATSAQSLILAVYGPASPQYINFVDSFKACHGHDDAVRALYGLFMSAKDDFDGGYVFNVDLRVSGEVFGDFVALAKQALSDGHKDVAAVLACAALEDALKRFATANGLNVDDKGMSDVVNALKSKSLVAGAQKTMLDGMPRIRNYAMHGDWSKLSEPDVSGVIGFVEQFLLTKFSP
jgi:hypothetical protein